MWRVIFCLLCLTHTDSDDSWLDYWVMTVKDNAEFGMDGIPPRKIEFGSSFKVTKEREDAVGTDKGWIKKSDVLTIDDAIEFFSEQIKTSPSAMSYVGRGRAYFLQNRFKASRDDYTRAIELSPKDNTILTRRAGSHFQLREFDKALADCEQALSLNPENRVARVIKERIEKERNTIDQEMKETTARIAQFPKAANNYKTRAMLHFRKREYSKARLDYDVAVKMVPHDAESLKMRGICYSLLGDYSNATRDYREAIKHEPDHHSAYSSLAWLLATCPEDKCRNGSEAIELANKAMKLGEAMTEESTQFSVLAAAYAETGNWEKAVENQRKAVEGALPEDEEEFSEQLELYEAKKPYRSPAVEKTNPAEKPVAAGQERAKDAKFASGKTAGQTAELSEGMTFVWCPEGTFTMGSPTEELGEKGKRFDDENQKVVTLTSGFWIQANEVSQSQFEKLLGKSPWKNQFAAQEDPLQAATYVDWKDATEFCLKLTKQDRSSGQLPAEWKYALPTEAQWEYACRAGTESKFSFGDDDGLLGEYAWWEGNTRGNGEHSREVGRKEPNAWGIYDMHGNAQEWCADWYGPKLAGGKNPLGPTKGSLRISRGGGWIGSASWCRSASRGKALPDTRSHTFGFRVAAVPVRK